MAEVEEESKYTLITLFVLKLIIFVIALKLWISGIGGSFLDEMIGSKEYDY